MTFAGLVTEAELPASGGTRSHPQRPKGADLVALVIAVVAVAAVGSVQVGTGVLVPALVPQVDHLSNCGAAIESVHFDYSGGSEGYLAVGYPIYQWCEAIDATPGSLLTANLFLDDLDTLNSHTIEGIALAYPFPMVDVSPSLPVAIPAGGYLTFAISFEAPYSNNGQSWPSAIVTAGPAGGTNAAPLDARASEGAECPTPSPWDPDSPLYPQICGQPAFQALLDQWGFSNFTWGRTTAPTWTVVWLGFNWVGSCYNSTWARYGPQCVDQEYWGANITSGTITGPTVSEGPLACACAEETGRLAPPWPLAILVAGPVVGGIAVCVGVVFWRRRRRPPTAPPEVLAPGTWPPP